MSGMGVFVIIFKDLKPLTNVAGSSVAHVTVVLNVSLHTG